MIIKRINVVEFKFQRNDIIIKNVKFKNPNPEGMKLL